MEQEISQTFDDQQEYIDLLDERIERLEGFIWTLIDYIGAYGGLDELQSRLDQEWRKELESTPKK